MSFLLQAQPGAPGSKIRTLAWALLALLYAIFAQQFSGRTAVLLLPAWLFELGSRVLYLAMLLAGFAAMGVLGQSQRRPLASMGLGEREGFRGEWSLGLKLGWGAIVACVLPVALIGGLYVSFNGGSLMPYASWLVAACALLVAALADEVVYRGYAFQRFAEVAGPGFATVITSLLFALGHYQNGVQSVSGTLNTLLLGVLLSMAYLRTKALWVGWGLRFGWLASMALLFGLPAGGAAQFSPVISSYTVAPFWMTGGDYGPEGSGLATVALLVLLVLLYRATGDLHYRWAVPEIVGAGIAVDIDALSRKQHEQGMGPDVQPAGQGLVQILPAERPRKEP